MRLRSIRAAARRRIVAAGRDALRPLTGRMGRARAWLDQRRRWSSPSLALAALALAAILPFLQDWFVLPGWLQRGTSSTALAQWALFALFALGLNVVVGLAGLLDLGYVAFWAIGSYTAALMSGAVGYSRAIETAGSRIPPLPTWKMWMWLIFLVALAVAVLAGILLGSPTLRLRGDYLAIVTLGFGEIIRLTANNLDSITLGPQGIVSIPHPGIRIGGLSLQWGTLTDKKYYWLLLGFVVLWVIAIRLLDNSRIGRAWVAIREDEVAAASMGVPVVRMKLAAFAIGACTAGVGGVVFAQQTNFMNPDTFTIIQSVLIVCMVVIGGMGSVAGAIVGAALITLLPEVFRGLEDYRFFVFGLAIVLIMVFRPQGLIPSRRRKAELRGGGVVDQQLYEAQHAGGAGR
jgi:branched-chain amino acid transport system permease protein